MHQTSHNHKKDPTRRFSDRVSYYVKYRPSYPEELLQVLKTECNLNRRSIIADIGSGTGLLSKLFLRNGNRVFGVEPNKEMRKTAELVLGNEQNFISIDGTAEATTLQAESVDFIMAGQAFHWFDVAKCRGEFLRALKPAGWVVLVWNDRKIDSTPFLAAYEEFLHEYGTDYGQVQHKTFDRNRLRFFFGFNKFTLQTFENSQVFDYDGLIGRALSSSYIPAKGQEKYAPMLTALKRLFNKFQKNNEIRFEYKTKIFFGQLQSH